MLDDPNGALALAERGGHLGIRQILDEAEEDDLLLVVLEPEDRPAQLPLGALQVGQRHRVGPARPVDQVLVEGSSNLSRAQVVDDGVLSDPDQPGKTGVSSARKRGIARQALRKTCSARSSASRTLSSR